MNKIYFNNKKNNECPYFYGGIIVNDNICQICYSYKGKIKNENAILCNLDEHGLVLTGLGVILKTKSFLIIEKA